MRPNALAPTRPHAPNDSALLDWYGRNKRELPWRECGDVYSVWISEVMLQQTKAVVVVPYFERWMSKYPSVESLANADPDEALALWQGLGYYRRCRNLLEGARHIVRNGWPASLEEWLGVPGVGRYTASAIAAIAYGARVGVVDGNVQRVFARLTGCRETGQALLSAAREWADARVPAERPGDWGQALMDLGATICTPAKPRCAECPLESWCVARQSWTVAELPVRPPKPQTVRLFHTVWVPYHDGAFGVRRIAEGGWWQGLWEFPRVDSPRKVLPPGESAELRALVGPGWLERLGVVRHRVTCHQIEVDAWLARAERRTDDLRWVGADEMASLAMPSPQRRIARLAIRHLGIAAQ